MEKANELDQLNSLLTDTLICLSDKEYKKAIDLCNEAIKLEPSNAEIWHCKSHAYRKYGFTVAAAECFSIALLLEPGQIRTRGMSLVRGK